MAQSKKGINSWDIAHFAGVSRSTVSRVVNNYPNVPDETRQKVMDVINKYDYYPDFSAQVMAGKGTNTIGLIWILNGSIAMDALASSFLVSIVEDAAEMGFLVLTCIVPNLTERQYVDRIKKIFSQNRIDGGIVIGAANQEPLIEELIERGHLIGLFDNYLPGHTEKNRLVINFEKDTGEKAVDYLHQIGHRKIAIIDGDLNRFSSFERHESFLRGFRKYALNIRPDWLKMGGVIEKNGYQCMKELLTYDQDLPTAVCCNNDSVAFGAIKACREAGVNVPDDISIIGIDDHILSADYKPALTTFRFDFPLMFKQLTQRLIEAINDPASSNEGVLSFSSKFIARASCRPL